MYNTDKANQTKTIYKNKLKMYHYCPVEVEVDVVEDLMFLLLVCTRTSEPIGLIGTKVSSLGLGDSKTFQESRPVLEPPFILGDSIYLFV